MHSTRFPVAIVGGGMVGMALAVALAEAGIRVAVIDREAFDRQHLPGFDGRVSAISYGSQCLLENIGAWTDMQPYAQPILDIRVAEKHAPAFIHYDHREIGDTPMGHIIENRYIRQALYRKAAENGNVTLFAPNSWRELEETSGAVRLTLDTGEEITAELLVAADGKHSPLREWAGIPHIQQGYGQTAMVATIRHSLPHRGLALEHFLPAGPFAVLPMTENRASLVWVERTEDAPLYLKLDTPTLEQEIRRRTGEYLGDIALEGQLFSYPLSLGLATDYAKGRIALIGDAAHSIHPIAGQGVNLGYRDVAVLAQLVIDRMRLGLSPAGDSVMQEYQQWRRFDAVALLGITDGLNRLFSNNNTILKALRNAGFAGVNHLGPLKRLFMQHAMGVMGDLPPLMQPPAKIGAKTEPYAPSKRQSA